MRKETSFVTLSEAKGLSSSKSKILHCVQNDSECSVIFRDRS
jgi:hypothetical protein